MEDQRDREGAYTHTKEETPWRSKIKRGSTEEYHILTPPQPLSATQLRPPLPHSAPPPPQTSSAIQAQTPFLETTPMQVEQYKRSTLPSKADSLSHTQALREAYVQYKSRSNAPQIIAALFEGRSARQV